MIDISFLVTDPDFASSYKVTRTTGEWVKGKFEITDTQTMTYYGAVYPATNEELEIFPEADRRIATMVFCCKLPNELMVTRSENNPGTSPGASDVVTWRGKDYKIVDFAPWHHAGWVAGYGREIGVSR